VEFGFRSRAVPAVAAGVYAHNDASRGLLRSLGVREEGRLRRHSFTDGEWRDIVNYGSSRRSGRRERRSTTATPTADGAD
jgi:RimJ/RimL family protein N-acetyltransferase